MTAPALVDAQAVRDYMELNASTSSRYSDGVIGSNIRAATWMLERATGRFFAAKSATLVFSTNGAALVTLPGLRSATTVTLQSATLTVDQTYWLIPDVQQTGVSTGIQLRGFTDGMRPGAPWWLSNPEWFDRNLDSPWYPGNYGGGRSLPNDLSIAGLWGYASGSEPEPSLHAVKVLASWITKRPDAILSGGITTPDGNLVDLSKFPIEVVSFIQQWRVGPWVYSL